MGSMASLARFSSMLGLSALSALAACRGGVAPAPTPDAARDVTTAVEDASVAVDAARLVEVPPDASEAGARTDAGADAGADARPKVVAVVPTGKASAAADEMGPMGKRGDVCQRGERSRGAGASGPVYSCGPGLSCCYPCGIQGCDWVCHTPAECDVDRQRP